MPPQSFEHQTALQHDMERIINESKANCRSYGLKPEDLPLPFSKLTEWELTRRQIRYHEILSVVDLLSEKVLHLLSGTPVMILVSDDQGYIISLFGDPSIKKTLQQLGMVEGIQLNEKEMGTNVVHLALTHGHPVQVIGPGHYHQALFQSACYCAPFEFKESSPLTGSIALMTTTNFHNPFTLPLLANMVDSMERELLLRQRSRHQTIISDLMINTMKNGVIITDAMGNVIDFNQFAEQITNRTRESVIGNPVFAFEQFGNYIYEVLRNHKRFEDIELTFTISLEDRIICLFDAMPIFNDQRMLLGAYAQFRDITERHKLEKQIVLSEKYSVIGKLGAGLAHEIRNPLTSVMGFIYLMREQCKNEKDLNHLNLIYAELQSMNKLLSDFVLMARPASPVTRSCIIEGLIRDTVQFMEHQAILRNCLIEDRPGTAGTMLLIDAGQIKQVLINLIQNALEAMPDGGTVTIETKLERALGIFSIRIRDTGMGMTEAQMKEVMNPFFTTKDSGLGLGLSTCYRIIENHKGKLTFTSQVGAGTTFTVSLPLH